MKNILLSINQPTSYIYWFIIMLLALTYSPLLMHEQVIDIFVREDHIFETLTAVYLFVISVLFLTAFYRLRSMTKFMGQIRLKQLSHLGLALLFFVATGEEISWGQRIFNIETPAAIKEINHQGELTLHNLNIFQGHDAIIPLDLSQLFVAFILVLCLIIPLLDRYSPKMRQRISPIFPILPLNIGYLVIVNYVCQKSMMRLLRLYNDFYLHPSMPIAQGVHEIREHDYALVLLLAVLYYTFIQVDLDGEQSRHCNR